MTYPVSRYKVILILLVAGICGFSLTVVSHMQSSEPYKTVRKSGEALEKDAIKRVEPRFPQHAGMIGGDGKVIVEVTVDEEGKVISAHALSGDHVLQKAATTAAREWRFMPAKLNGEPVRVIGKLQFVFQPQGETLVNEGVEALEKEVRANPNSVEARFKLAEALIENHRYPEAIREYKQIISQKPDSATAYFGLGEVYYSQQRFEQAVEAYERTIRLDPHRVEAYYGLGWSKRWLKLSDELIKTWKDVLTIKPDDLEVAHRAYVNLALNYEDKSRYEEAIEAYRELINIEKKKNQIEANSASPYRYALNIAELYEKMGKPERAIEEYKEAVSLSIDDSEKVGASLGLGAFLEKLGRPNEAIQVYTQLTSLGPDWIQPRLALAKLYLRLGDEASAQREYLILKRLNKEAARELDEFRELMKKGRQ